MTLFEMAPTRADLSLFRMNRDIVRRELLKLKNETFPKDDAGFLRASKLFHSTIAQVEARTVPGIVNLERWVNACSWTLSQFFAHIEGLESGKRKKTEEPRLISLARSLAQRGDPAVVSALQTLMERQLSA